MAESKMTSFGGYKLPGMRGKSERGGYEKPQSGGKTLKRLFRYFKNETGTAAKLIFAVAVVVVCSVSAPGLQSMAIDSIAEGRFGDLPKALIIMGVMYLIHCFCTYLQNILSAGLSQRIVGKMRDELFAVVINLPIKYIDNHPHGDIMSRMTNDVENISNIISQCIGPLISGIMMIIGTVFMMVKFCPKLAALSCITVVMTVCATKLLSQIMKNFYTKRQVLLGELNSAVEEAVYGGKTVTAYGMQKRVTEEFDKVSDELRITGIIAEALGGAMGPCMNVINNTGFVIIAVFGGYFALKGEISIGVISAFIIYAKQFGRPIDELAQIYGQIQSAVAGAERVFEIMDYESEDKSGSINMEAAEGIVEFKDVCFGYYSDKPVLKNFSLKIKAGQKAALVGATGSGKTTVVNLLMRFYDIDSGEITIDGVNIKDIDCRELRKNTAIVLQDTVLFTDSVRNNLKYANENADDAEMIKAAEMSNCNNMIMRMEKGYDTMLSGSGEELSQGERQLLAIGRAFIANPKILILDEATSNVDTRTEKRIQDAMANIMKNRTSLIIAHRLSTIKDADLIVVMDNGMIVEKGCHGELLKKKGKYYELYMTQFAGEKI